jgi:hypothetical protein
LILSSAMQHMGRKDDDRINLMKVVWKSKLYPLLYFFTAACIVHDQIKLKLKGVDIRIILHGIYLRLLNCRIKYNIQHTNQSLYIRITYTHFIDVSNQSKTIHDWRIWFVANFWHAYLQKKKQLYFSVNNSSQLNWIYTCNRLINI